MALIGRQTAKPLALEIAGTLSGDAATSWPRPPEVRERTVCSLSGFPPTAACPDVHTAEFLAGTSSDVPCPLHRVQGKGSGDRIVTMWPGPVADFLAGQSREGPETADRRLIIHSPADGAEYVVAPGVGASGDCLDFAVEAGPASSPIFWFVNDRLAGVTRGREPLRWRMAPGRYELVASDARGRSAAIAFSVRSLEGLGKCP
jgi:penicillin-binding protein 1C